MLQAMLKLVFSAAWPECGVNDNITSAITLAAKHRFFTTLIIALSSNSTNQGTARIGAHYQQSLSHQHRASFGAAQLGDHPIHRCRYRQFHFHRLHQDQYVAGLYALTGGG